MTHILHISASTRSDKSYSRQFGTLLADSLCESIPQPKLIRRELGKDAPPHPGYDFVEASLKKAGERNDADRAALAVSESLIREIEMSDIIVIDTPMHNFTIPSVLKAWIDYVVRPGRTFRGTREGKVGLLPDRPVFCLIASGGPIGRIPTWQEDFASPYLRYCLGTIGLKNISILNLDSLSRGPAAVEQAHLGFVEWYERWRTTRNNGQMQ